MRFDIIFNTLLLAGLDSDTVRGQERSGGTWHRSRSFPDGGHIGRRSQEFASVGERDTPRFLEENCSSWLVSKGGEDSDVASLGDLTDGAFLKLFHRSQEKLKVEKKVSAVSSSWQSQTLAHNGGAFLFGQAQQEASLQLFLSHLMWSPPVPISAEDYWVWSFCAGGELGWVVV